MKRGGFVFRVRLNCGFIFLLSKLLIGSIERLFRNDLIPFFESDFLLIFLNLKNKFRNKLEKHINFIKI